MNREERIKNKIVKLHAKNLKMEKNPSKISMYAFIPVALILGIGLPILGNLIYAHHIVTILGVLTGLGLTSAGIYKFSSEYHDIRKNRIECKLIDLEMLLTEKYGFDNDGNILSVPADKVRDYLDGKYQLTKSYWVEYNNKFANMTTKEIEDLRKCGYEFHKNIDRLKALSPEQVKKITSKGYEISRDGIETIFTKDGKKLQLDCNKASYLFPAYDRKLTEVQIKEKENLINRMISKDKTIREEDNKDEIIDHENNIDLNRD